MTDYDHAADLSSRSVKKLTDLLSLPPQFGVANPNHKWLRQQQEAVQGLPESCRRPPSDAINPMKLITRGLMKVSERYDLPFVPNAAVLCPAHRGLHPWRIRDLFLLMACEAGPRSDRIRRYRGHDGIPPSQAVQDFVYRMSSVASMWISPPDFARRFGYAPPIDFPRVESGCEACMLAVVGARAQLLVDLRANLISRRHRSTKEPTLLRFIEAWISWFDSGAALIQRESDTLGKELRQIRKDIGKRRHERRQKRRSQGKHVRPRSARKPERDSRGYPLPKSSRRHQMDRERVASPPTAAQMSSPSNSRSQSQVPAPLASLQDPDVITVIEEAENGKQRTTIRVFEEPEDNVIEVFEEHDDYEDRLDAQNQAEEDPDWAQEVGSYYWDDNHPGARSNWKTDPVDIHPAFRAGSVVAPTRVGSVTAKAPSYKSEQGSIYDENDWYEPSLHTAGGRTDLNLAPRVPMTPSLANLTRGPGNPWNTDDPDDRTVSWMSDMESRMARSTIHDDVSAVSGVSGLTRGSAYEPSGLSPPPVGPSRLRPPTRPTNSRSHAASSSVYSTDEPYNMGPGGRPRGRRHDEDDASSRVTGSGTSIGMFMRHHEGINDDEPLTPSDSVSVASRRNSSRQGLYHKVYRKER